MLVLRRPLQGEMLLAQEDDGQQQLGFIEADRKGGKRITGYEYAVLVTNLEHEILSLGQLYRDRADAENTFDELKNQWGWDGFTTHDLHRCQLSARAVALLYNWWSLFVRLANPEARLEAITSRPWLMSSVGRRTEHAGQTTITLTGQHAHFDKARQVLTRISSQLQAWVSEAAEQLKSRSVWMHCCEYLKRTLAALGPPRSMPANSSITHPFEIVIHEHPKDESGRLFWCVYKWVCRSVKVNGFCDGIMLRGLCIKVWFSAGEMGQ